jgi:hypothetical protein
MSIIRRIVWLQEIFILILSVEGRANMVWNHRLRCAEIARNIHRFVVVFSNKF